MEPITVASQYTDVTLATFSLAQIGAIIVVGVPLAIIAGFWIGTLHRRRLIEREVKIENLVSETTQGAYLALLGLLLAFSFGNALSIAQSMKVAATDEAAAIGTAFLRADYLDDPGRTVLKNAILDYARTRLLPSDDEIDTDEELQDWLETSLVAQSKLWPATLSATREPTPPPIQTFVAGAINDAIDAHLYRVAKQDVPLEPFSQTVVLLATTMAIFLLANRTGLLGRSLTWRMLAFSLLTGLVLYLIADIRRGYQGLIRIGQSELHATIFEMEQLLGRK